MNEPTNFTAEDIANAVQVFDRLLRFEIARLCLIEQSKLRHGDSILRAVQCVLCEDEKTVTLFADYDSDEPICESFELPEATTEAEFDHNYYVAQCERAANECKRTNAARRRRRGCIQI